MKTWFRNFAQKTAEGVGSPAAFAIAIATMLAWAALGPHYHFSDTWQLLINTGTSVATFLIVFLIQHTQNRDFRVMQLKLDELIRAVAAARTELVQMEALTDDQLDTLQNEFRSLQERAATGLQRIEQSRARRLQPH